MHRLGHGNNNERCKAFFITSVLFLASTTQQKNSRRVAQLNELKTAQPPPGSSASKQDLLRMSVFDLLVIRLSRV